MPVSRLMFAEIETIGRMGLIRLSCSSSVYKDIPLANAIGQIADAGYTAIELRAGHEGLVPGEDISRAVNTLKDALTSRTMSVANIAVSGEILYNGQTPYSDIWASPHYIEYIKYYSRLARSLNCNSLTISPGRAAQRSEQTLQPSSLVTGLNEIARFARGLGVAIGVACGPGLLLKNASDVQALFPKVRGLKLAFNTGRSHLACETPCVVVTELKHHVKHIHLADVGSGNRAYLLPGDGEIEWISFFRTLKWIGYEGFVTVDLSSYTDMPDLAAKRAFYYLSNLLNAFRNSREKKIA